MLLERRKQGPTHSVAKSSELPVDYLKMVKEVFDANFDEGMKRLGSQLKEPRFQAWGAVFPDELLVAVTVTSEGTIAATTVSASVDFDPKASAPTLQDLLSRCIDAIGSVYGSIFEEGKPERMDVLVSETLRDAENLPFEWTELEIEKRAVWVRLDKSNPALDQMAEEWLNANDPDRKAAQEDEESATEDLFVTGPRDGSGKKQPVH